MSAELQKATTPALEWFEPGIPVYHVESRCGRYSVSRVVVSPHNAVHYIAWRFRRSERGRVIERHELASTQIPLKSTREQRAAAREAMQRRCQEDATTRAAA